MGKYVSVKMPKGAALVYPEDAANAVVEAWKRAVEVAGEDMRNNYVEKVSAAAADPDKIAEMERALASHYEANVRPKIPRLREAMAPVRGAYKTARAQELRRRGTFPAPAIVVKGR